MPLVNNEWPYPAPTDAIAAYPETGHTLAQRISDLATDWRAYKGTKAWFGLWDSNASYAGGGLIVTGAAAPGGVWIRAGASGTANATIAYYHAAGWYEVLNFRYATEGTPNEMFVTSAAQWRLMNPRNGFAGVFLPAVTAEQQPANAGPARLLEAAPAQRLGLEDQGDEVTYLDLAGTLAGLVDTINQLAARVLELEGKATP